jgi:homoserine kinase
MNSVTVHTPATLSNLCSGFDILGMALEQPYDVITINKIEGKDIVIKHLDNYGLSTDPKQNIAGVVMEAMRKNLQTEQGFEIIIDKKIKPGSGIGSSAASAAGVAVAANEILQANFNKQQLVQFAMEGEVLASGSRHADNLAPCIYGGLVLIRDTPTLDIIPLNTPELFITIVHPQIEIKTSYARSILPKDLPLKTAITQWANVAGLVTGFIQHDYSLISRSLKDVVAEPVRSPLIPGFDEVRERSMQVGALGGGISGSGPSLFMLSRTAEIANEVEKEMRLVYVKLGIEFKTYVSTIAEQGVRIV